MNFINKITTGNSRSVKAKKNILGMLLLKGGNILIGLLLIPLTLNYVDSECFGIWLTLSSMVAWVAFLDIGISNGLRNRLTEAMAKNNKDLCQKYVSTTYAILTLIFLPLMIIMLVVAKMVDWSSFLNISYVNPNELLIAISIIIAYFCINFVLNTINVIILAEQRPADVSLRQFIQQAVSLCIIYILTKLTTGNLIYLCAALCASPLIVVAIFNLTLFGGRYNYMRPKLSKVDFKIAPNLLKLGAQFFICQVAAIVQFQMINFIIIKYYGAQDVTNYNIAFKYFNVLYLVWWILVSPLWSATTEALANGEKEWVRNAQKRYLKVLVVFILCGAIMLLLSQLAYKIWVGDVVSITYSMSVWMLLYNISMMFRSIFVMAINGSGKLRLQTYSSLVSPILFIGLCALFINQGVGVYAPLISVILSDFYGLVLAPIQCSRLLKE